MKKIAFDERDAQKFRKLLTGGLAGGTSIGLGLALANYLKDLQEETTEDTSVDDNILYLDVPSKPQVAGAPVKSASISGGVGLTAALIATLGSAAAVRNLYQEYKKKDLQRQLDKAQVAYSEQVVNEADELDKKASEGVPMRPSDVLTSVPLTALLLTTLATGALTYKGLNKYFPAAKKPTSNTPKRVVIRRKKPEPSFYEEEPNEDEIEKTASYEDLPSRDVLDDAVELAVKLAMENPAPHSDLRNLVYAVAAGRGSEISVHGLDYGMDSALDLVKNAATQKSLHPERISLAVSHCVKSAFLRPVVEMLAYAEFNDMAPCSVKAASEMSEAAQDTLIKIAGLFGAANRNDFWSKRYDNRFTVKEGAMGGALLEELLAQSLNTPEEGEGEDSAAQVPLTTETESEVSESQKPEDQNQEKSKQRVRVSEQETSDDDQVDMLMSGLSGG